MQPKSVIVQCNEALHAGLPCRVQFARGPLDGPPDGHPAHEGQTARQRRSLEAGYPQVSLKVSLPACDACGPVCTTPCVKGLYNAVHEGK
jgi:hypothetical protein